MAAPAHLPALSGGVACFDARQRFLFTLTTPADCVEARYWATPAPAPVLRTESWATARQPAAASGSRKLASSMEQWIDPGQRDRQERTDGTHGPRWTRTGRESAPPAAAAASP